MNISEIDDVDYDLINCQVLSKVFSYLRVHELLRAARVCRLWRESAENPSLWKRVSLKNSLVSDWEGLAVTLQARASEHLDLRKMLIDDKVESTWDEFILAVPKITTLTRLDLCKCPGIVVERVMEECPNLRVLSATAIQAESISLESLCNLSSCCELRLKSVSSITLEGSIASLLKLSDLTHLSLTSVINLSKQHIDVIKTLVKLRSLELGDCSDLPTRFGTTMLVKLKNLERLRLEKGQDDCNIFDIVRGAAKLKKLSQLELVNFDVKPGFEKHLPYCKNVKMLLIIPTYVSQSATTSNIILKSVFELSGSLTHFVWGVTQELLKVTELFRNDDSRVGNKNIEDSIPVLKPIPYKSMETASRDKGGRKNDEQCNSSNPEVEILPLTQLQELLSTSLPKTRVKILKIPFHATWRQSLSQVSY